MASEISGQREKAIRAYLETWAAAFADALQQIAAFGCRAIAVDGEEECSRAREQCRGGLAVHFDCSGGLAGGQKMMVSSADAVVLGRLLTGETGDVPAELPEAERDAATELLRQVAGLAAGRLKERAGDEVRFHERKQGPEEWKPPATKAIRLEGAAPAPLLVVFELDDALAAALDREHEAPAASSAAMAGNGAGGGEAEATNLHLLLDIELDASIRFGQKELLLKDVLNLRPGTVVEMARRVNEPAELLVAGRLMARGEVVVVEGNYGLRITEILAPADRMAVLQG